MTGILVSPNSVQDTDVNDVTYGVFIQDGDGPQSDCAAILSSQSFGFLASAGFGDGNEEDALESSYSLSYVTLNGGRFPPGTSTDTLSNMWGSDQFSDETDNLITITGPALRHAASSVDVHIGIRL